MRPYVSAVLGVAIVAGLVAIVSDRAGREQRVEQPIAFNHTVHLEKADVECIDCHTDAATRVYAGLPGKEVCLDCHDVDEEADTHPEKAKLLPFADSDDEIPWVRVAVTRPDVFFSHRRHVTAGGIDCLRCHADQPSLSEPPSVERLVMSMDDCIGCHEDNGASTDCLACHR